MLAIKHSPKCTLYYRAKRPGAKYQATITSFRDTTGIKTTRSRILISKSKDFNIIGYVTTIWGRMACLFSTYGTVQKF